MELNPRESAIIAFALTVLAIDGAPLLNADSTELRDLSQKIIKG
jgi:hypothetical protein